MGTVSARIPLGQVQAAVEAEYLGDLADLAKKEPKVLDPWDPFGSLAD